MSNIQTRSTLADLGKTGLGPKFEQVFEQNLIKYDGRKIAEKLFAFMNTDRATFRTTGLTGYNYMVEFNEGDPFPELINVKTFQTLYSIRDYGGAVTVTDDYLQDHEKLGMALDEMANLAASIDISEVRSAFQILNGGFGTSTKVNGTTLHRYNSEALFSATHARADGGSSQSNTSANSIPLTELNLETLRLSLVKQLTDIGQPIMNMGRLTLAVPDDLEKNAVIFTQSSLRPTTNNNDMNFYRGRIDVLSSRWLNGEQGGSTTAWFLIANLPGMASPLRVYRKGGPRFEEAQPESRTWNKVFAAKNRYAVGHSEWKGAIASAGS